MNSNQQSEYSREENYSHYVRNAIRRHADTLNEELSRFAIQLAQKRVTDQNGGKAVDYVDSIREELAREFWSAWGGLYNNTTLQEVEFALDDAARLIDHLGGNGKLQRRVLKKLQEDILDDNTKDSN